MLIKYIYLKLLTNFVTLHKFSNALYFFFFFFFFDEEVYYLEISSTDRKVVAYIMYQTPVFYLSIFR